MRLECVCLYLKYYLKKLFFIIYVRFSNMKICEFEIKLAILVLSIIIINIIDNVSKLGRITSHCVSLVTDIKRVEDKYYQGLYQTIWNKFILVLYKIHRIRPIIKNYTALFRVFIDHPSYISSLLFKDPKNILKIHIMIARSPPNTTYEVFVQS